MASQFIQKTQPPLHCTYSHRPSSIKKKRDGWKVNRDNDDILAVANRSEEEKASHHYRRRLGPTRWPEPAPVSPCVYVFLFAVLFANTCFSFICVCEFCSKTMGDAILFLPVWQFDIFVLIFCVSAKELINDLCCRFCTVCPPKSYGMRSCTLKNYGYWLFVIFVAIYYVI